MSCSMDRTVIHCCVFTSFCRSRTQPHNRNGGESDGQQTKERAATHFMRSPFLIVTNTEAGTGRRRRKKKKKKEMSAVAKEEEASKENGTESAES